MTTLHVTSTYNVEATLNAYFKAAINAMTIPTYYFLSSPLKFAENTPQATASMPSFSFIHLPVGAMDIYHGRNAEPNTRATKDLGILEICVWTTRNNNSNYNAQLRGMHAMVDKAYKNANGGVIIKDYQSNPSAPVTTAYRIILNDLAVVSVSADPNPDIERRRLLVKYEWTGRSTD